MEHAPYASRLRYLDADDVDDSTVDFSGLDVRDRDNSKLGDINGFIVDSASGRVYHIVVDSGGWFTSRRFLLPVGHATLDRDARALRLDVGQDALRRYPEFDEGKFQTFSDDDLQAFEQRTAEACCPDESLADVSVGSLAYETRRHYSQPGWWTAGAAHDRLRPVPLEDHSRPAREAYDRERVTAREETGRSDAHLRDSDLPRRPGDDTSPHFGGRAQPGDVLGLETGGETTAIGETAEDEDERRRGAERTTGDHPPRRSDR